MDPLLAAESSSSATRTPDNGGADLSVDPADHLSGGVRRQGARLSRCQLGLRNLASEAGFARAGRGRRSLVEHYVRLLDARDEREAAAFCWRR